MSKQFKFWVDSSKNISFKYEEIFNLDDMGLTEEDWQEMTEEEKEFALEEYAKELLFNRYIEYGHEEIEE